MESVLINLTDIFKSEGKIESFDISYDNDLESNGMVYNVKDGNLVLTVINAGQGKVRISGKGDFTVTMPCDRCLTDVDVKVSPDFEYEVDEPDERSTLSDEEFFMDGYVLDSESLIRNELIMGLPMKVLCKDDCKGLCPVCFINLNERSCGCDTFVPDPRMAAIQDIFNANNKEV